MIIDAHDKAAAFAHGVEPENACGETFFDGGDVCRDVTFRNFAHLCMEETLFINCTFEDCLSVAPDECRMIGCTFKNVNNIESVRTDFTACTFIQCCAEGPFLTIDSQGKVDGCVFDTITALGEDGYAIYAVYGNRSDVQAISRCTFTDCQVENDEGSLCYCAYFKPYSSYRTIEIDNVDYNTCEGVR